MKKYQEQVNKWFEEKGWDYWEPLAITTRLFEECGEFAREVNHIYGPKKKKLEEKKKDVEDEMGDIIYTLICFANSHDIDLGEAVQKSIDKVADRDKDRYKK
ncbi:MAG: nucleotide pyrophosphohydrolase [Candidatus Pacebacteria bacterium]|nr:nucleotide pyrophosphohydrolase [Candidatus Paceibacterota bacterium]